MRRSKRFIIVAGAVLAFTTVGLRGFEKDAKPTPQQAAPQQQQQTTSQPSAKDRAPGTEPQVSIQPRVRPSTEIKEGEAGETSIRVDTTLVLINVTVTDPLGRFVTGLEKEQFELFEDKVAQTIAQFSSEDAPLSIGLVFDASGSMGSKLSKSRQAAAQLFRSANPEDEFFLVQFNDRPELVVPFTTNTEEIQNRLTFTNAKGRTALLDGVYMAMHQMKKARNPRKAVIILSDGGDNSSRYTESEIRNAVREADVQIFAIGIFEPIAGRGRTAEEMGGPGLLTDLAEATGGRHYPVENIAELPDVAATIGMELRTQYVLGYTPTNLTKDGKYRRVTVKMKKTKSMPPLKAFYRLGYYAPTN